MAFFTRVYAAILGATLAFTMSAVAQDRMTQAQYDALALATYQNRAVGDAFQFEVPETGEHPIVGRKWISAARRNPAPSSPARSIQRL